MAGTETTENYPYLQPSTLGFFATETDLGYVSIPDPRCYAELEVIGDCLYVVGGCRTSTTDYADTMLILDLQTQTWREARASALSREGPRRLFLERPPLCRRRLRRHDAERFLPVGR